MIDNNTAMASGAEKRSTRRVAAKQKIATYDFETGLLVGQVANFHDKGFMLISGSPLVEDDIYRFRLHFARPVGERTEIVVGAECLWVRATSGDQVWAGFSIIDIADEDRFVLIELAGELDG